MHAQQADKITAIGVKELAGRCTVNAHPVDGRGIIANVLHVAQDMATTSALCPIARPGYWEFMGGVTRSLNISYLKAVPIGTTVRLSSKVLSVGKQMAMIRGSMTSLDGKLIYCTVEHRT